MVISYLIYISMDISFFIYVPIVKFSGSSSLKRGLKLNKYSRTSRASPNTSVGIRHLIGVGIGMTFKTIYTYITSNINIYL